jgi:hypothetical protein
MEGHPDSIVALRVSRWDFFSSSAGWWIARTIPCQLFWPRNKITIAAVKRAKTAAIRKYDLANEMQLLDTLGHRRDDPLHTGRSRQSDDDHSGGYNHAAPKQKLLHFATQGRRHNRI